METNDNSKLFDTYYFAHGCGRPYQRDEEWLAFFDSIAEQIVKRIQPETVLDTGCAMGFLVEGLRKRGVEAYGLDISEYAIQNVHEDIKEYCWLGSVSEPFPQKYDLIVCIEVLEHLPQDQAEKAVVNICKHTDDVLFSSTPFDYKEASHFNVQPPEYWAELFSIQGFFRDVDFNTSFITPWTVRFRKRKETHVRLVREYERMSFQIIKENADLRSLVLDNRNQLADFSNTIKSINNQLVEKDQAVHLSEQTIQTLERKILEKNSMIEANKNQLQILEEEINSLKDQSKEKDKLLYEKIHNFESLESQISTYVQEIKSLNEQVHQLEFRVSDYKGQLTDVINSRSWLLMKKFQRIRLFFIPKDSEREEIASKIVHFFLSPFLINNTKKDVHAAGGDAQIPVSKDLYSYQNWITENEPSQEELNQQRLKSKQFELRPLISIIIPVYNPPPRILKETIESVISQTYENWQLCLVDGNSQVAGVREIIEQAAQADDRIRVKYLDKNLGISKNSNEALNLAEGEFIQLLDHDDVLSSEALFQIVRRINAVPTTDIIYFDEDKLSENGRNQLNPFFKPDWSPELFLSANYLTHPVIRKSLVMGVDGFNPEMDGTQDWDLIFRCTERTKNIEHIPRVLYHWRQIHGSTAAKFSAKPWVFERQLRCIKEHLQRSGIIGAKTFFSSTGIVRVTWPVKGSKVSIIIPNKDKVEYLQRCITSILQLSTYQNFDITIVDNKSRESNTMKYYETIREDPRIRIVEIPQEFNFSAANNLGVTHATGDLLLFLNNDTEVLDPDWLEEMVRWAELPEIGAVGAKLLYPDGRIQHAGVVIGMEGHASHVFWGVKENYCGFFGSVNWYRNYSAVTGACMMIPRDLFEEINGFDESYQLAFSDVEICLRIQKKGYRIVYTPFARLTHFEGKTRGNHIPDNDTIVGYSQMREIINIGDSFYNPNLSYKTRVPTLAQINEESREERIERIFKEALTRTNDSDNNSRGYS